MIGRIRSYRRSISARRRGSVTARIIEDDPRGKHHKFNNMLRVHIRWALNVMKIIVEKNIEDVYLRKLQRILSKIYALMYLL